jgi:hypothetical protein
MCCAPFDDHYLFTGGRWVRHNPTSGRVGSAFDEAGGPVEVHSATAQPEEIPAPAQPQSRPGETRSVVPRDLGESYLQAP